MQKNTSSELHHQPSLSSLQIISLDEHNRKITLTITQLIELTHHDDKLHHTIKSINALGIRSITQQHYSQAMGYFNQCERILEYAASCGKTIDRSLIIAVLNNQALLYHKTNDIGTAYNYLQAILYNLKLFVDAPDNKNIQSQLKHHATTTTHSVQGEQFVGVYFQEIKSLVERKQQLAIFYLRFSGLNSQRQMHNESLHNARQALQQFKQLCKLCYYYHKITTPNNPHIKMLMKQLSSLDDSLTSADITQLREQLRRLCGGLVDSNQIYHQAYLNLSVQNKQQVMQTDVHGLFDLQPIFIADNVLQDQNRNIQLCSSYFMQINKVLYIMGAYFAIAVETQQIECPQHSQNSKIEQLSKLQSKPKQNSVTAQVAYLYSLIIGYKYLPNNIKLTNYLNSLYTQTYPSALIQHVESPVVSEIFQTHTPPTTKTMQQNLNQLKQKYKNYIVEREMDLSDSVSHQERRLKDSKNINSFQQEKKQSKKLFDLLKQDTNNFLAPPNQYLNEVQYIDSFEMANSHSATQNSVSIGMKTISSDDVHNNESKKEKNGLTLKQITECQSQMLQETQRSGKMVSKFSANPTKIPHQTIFNKNSKGRDISKSKSVKHIKSKSKQAKPKISSKKNISIYTIPSVAVIHSVNNTSRKAISKSKSPSKHKNELTTTNASQQKKVIKTEKKMPILSSERIKSSHTMIPLASVKNCQSIKFNKTKCPVIQQRNNKITSVINQKNPKKQKKSTSSKKMSSKSLSLAKSQHKKLNNTANLKIYTSVGWSKSKKQ